MAAFGYQTGDGTGANNLIFPLGPLASRYQNDTGGTVIVDKVTLLGVGTALSGTLRIGLYSDAPGAPYNRLATATLPGVVVGNNDFDLSATPIPIRDGEWIWVSLSGPPNLRVDGIFATAGSVRPTFADQDPYGIFVGQDLILPAQLSGADTWDASATELRAADVLAEPIVEGASALRTAEVLAEPLSEGASQLRVAEILAEPVTEAGSTLRCALVLVEALISVPEDGDMATELLPTELGMTFEAKKSPVFATQVRTTTSLRSTRNSLTPFPAWDFEVSFPYLPTDAPFRAAGQPDFDRICGFFLQMHGRHGAFLFRDPLDHHVVGHTIGTGDGVTTEFSFKRTLGGFAEPVGQLDVDAGYTVYADGVAVDPGDFTFRAPNVAVFDVASAEGVVITADFDFFFVCHFNSDAADFEQFNRDLYELRQVGFRADPA